MLTIPTLSLPLESKEVSQSVFPQASVPGAASPAAVQAQCINPLNSEGKVLHCVKECLFQSFGVFNAFSITEIKATELRPGFLLNTWILVLSLPSTMFGLRN